MRTADYLKIIRGEEEREKNNPPPNFRLGVIPATYSSGKPRVRFEGESTASSKEYEYLRTYAPSPGDRVLLARVGNSYVVIDSLTESKPSGTLLESTTVSNTTTETTIFTQEIPAGSLVPGRVLRIKTNGLFSTANSSDTVTIRFKIAGTTVLSATTTAGNVTDGPWRSEFVTTIRTVGSSGTEISYLNAVFDNELKDTSEDDGSLHNIDTTVAADLTVTVQWSAADPSNSITVNQGFADFID